MYSDSYRAVPRILAVASALIAFPAFASGGDYGHHEHPAAPDTVTGDVAVPALSIVMPAQGDTTSNPAAVVFETDGDIGSLTMSAAKMGIHLHVSVDGRSVMPIRDQLISVGAGRFAFIIEDELSGGPHEVSVYWADAAHRTIKESVRTVEIISK